MMSRDPSPAPPVEQHGLCPRSGHSIIIAKSASPHLDSCELGYIPEWALLQREGRPLISRREPEQPASKWARPISYRSPPVAPAVFFVWTHMPPTALEMGEARRI